MTRWARLVMISALGWGVLLTPSAALADECSFTCSGEAQFCESYCSSHGGVKTFYCDMVNCVAECNCVN
jgi:hypothetical protein